MARSARVCWRIGFRGGRRSRLRVVRVVPYYAICSTPALLLGSGWLTDWGHFSMKSCLLHRFGLADMGDIFDADHSRQGCRWSRSRRAEVWPRPSSRRYRPKRFFDTGLLFFVLLLFSCRSMLSPLYMAEISPPETRGSLLALEQFSIVLGCVIGFWTGFSTRNGKSVPRFGSGTPRQAEL